MATVSEKIARQVSENKGYYPGDPQCYAVFKYYNHNFDKECFAIAYTKADFERYHEFRIVEILWQLEEDDDL